MEYKEYHSEKWKKMPHMDRYIFMLMRNLSIKRKNLLNENEYIFSMTQELFADVAGLGIATVQRAWPRMKKNKIIFYKRDSGEETTILILELF